jgi:hypothetical protein
VQAMGWPTPSTLKSKRTRPWEETVPVWVSGVKVMVRPLCRNCAPCTDRQPEQRQRDRTGPAAGHGTVLVAPGGSRSRRREVARRRGRLRRDQDCRLLSGDPVQHAGQALGEHPAGRGPQHAPAQRPAPAQKAALDEGQAAPIADRAIGM